MAKRIVEGLWDCQFCDTKGIRGSVRECPGCGKPRGDNVKFYLPSDYSNQKSVNLSEKEKLPDWQCAYCGSYNKATDLKCSRCEAPRDGKDYFELHKEVKESTYSENHVNTNWKCPYCGTENPQGVLICQNCGGEKGKDKAPDTKNGSAGFWDNIWPPKNLKLLIILIPVVIFLIILFLGSIKHDFVAEGFKWETKVDIEEFKTVEESDWYLPDGARLLYTREEIHHYSKNDTGISQEADESLCEATEIASNAEKVNQTAYEAGYNPFIYKVYADDLGNGYFEVDDGGSDYSNDSGGTDTSEPVYQTKYYYEIDKWVVTRDVRSSGEDKEPYEPEIELGENERKGNVTVTYMVYASKDGKKAEYYEIDEDSFYRLSVGDKFKAKGMGSTIRVVE